VFSKITAPSADLLRRQARLSDATASPPAAPPRQSPIATGMSGVRLVQMRTEHTVSAPAAPAQAPFAEVALGANANSASGGSSPAKRALGAADGADPAGDEAEGSPSKRQSRDDGAGDQDGAAAAGPERSHSYGLRPKKLDLSRSFSSSGSTSISSNAAARGTATSGAGRLRKSASECSTAPSRARVAAPTALQRSTSSRGPRAGDKAVAAGVAVEQAAGSSIAPAKPAEAGAAPRSGRLRQAALSSMFRQERKTGGAKGKAGPASGGDAAAQAAAEAEVGAAAEARVAPQAAAHTPV
jgi:hypothetical protein